MFIISFFFLNSDQLNLIKQNFNYFYINFFGLQCFYPLPKNFHFFNSFMDPFSWVPAINYYSQHLWSFWNFSDTLLYFIYLIPLFCIFSFLLDFLHILFRRWFSWTFEQFSDEDTALFDADEDEGFDDDYDEDDEEEDYESEENFIEPFYLLRYDLFTYSENLRDPSSLYLSFQSYQKITEVFYFYWKTLTTHHETSEMYVDDLETVWHEVDLVFCAFFFGLIIVYDFSEFGQLYGFFGYEYPKAMLRHLQVEQVRVLAAGDIEFFNYTIERGVSELTQFFDNYVFSTGHESSFKKRAFYSFYWENFFSDFEPFFEVQKVVNYSIFEKDSVNVVDSSVLPQQLRFSRYRNMMREDVFLKKQARSLLVNVIENPVVPFNKETKPYWMKMRRFKKGKFALGLQREYLGDFLSHMRLYDMFFRRNRGLRRTSYAPHHLSIYAMLPRWVAFGHLYTFYNPQSRFFASSKLEVGFQLFARRQLRKSFFLKISKNRYLNNLLLVLQFKQNRFSKKVGKYSSNILFDNLFVDSFRSHFRLNCWDFIPLLKQEGGIHFFVDETYRIPRRRRFLKVDTQLALKSFKKSLRVFLFNHILLDIYQSKYGLTLGSFFFTSPGGSLSFFFFSIDSLKIDWDWYKKSHYVLFPDLTFSYNQVKSKQLDLYGKRGASYSFFNKDTDNLLSSYPAFFYLPDLDTFWAAARRIVVNRLDGSMIYPSNFGMALFKTPPFATFLTPLSSFSLLNSFFCTHVFDILHSFRPFFNKNAILYNMFLDPISLYQTQKQLYKYFLQDVFSSSFSVFLLSKYLANYLPTLTSPSFNLFFDTVVSYVPEPFETFDGHPFVLFSSSFSIDFWKKFLGFWKLYQERFYLYSGHFYFPMFEDFVLNFGDPIFFFDSLSLETLIFPWAKDASLMFKSQFVMPQFLYAQRKPFLIEACDVHVDYLYEFLGEYAFLKTDYMKVHKTYPFRPLQYHIIFSAYGPQKWVDFWPYWKKSPLFMPVIVTDNSVISYSQNKYYPFTAFEFSRLLYTEPFHRFWTKIFKTEWHFQGEWDFFLEPSINPNNTPYIYPTLFEEPVDYQDNFEDFYIEDLNGYLQEEFVAFFEISTMDNFYSNSVPWKKVDWFTRFVFFLHGVQCDNAGVFHLAVYPSSKYKGFSYFTPSAKKDFFYWNQEDFEDSIFQSYYHPFSYSSTPLQRLDGFLVQATFGNMKMGLDFAEMPYAIDNVDEWDPDTDLVEWLGEDLDPRFGSVLPSFSIDSDLNSFDWDVINEEFFFIPDSRFPVMDVSDDEDDLELYEVDWSDPDSLYEINPYLKLRNEAKSYIRPGPASYFITNVFPTVAWHGYPIPIDSNGWVPIQWFWRISYSNHINHCWFYNGATSHAIADKRMQRSYTSFFSEAFGFFYQSFRGRFYPTTYIYPSLVGSSRFFSSSKKLGHGLDLSLPFIQTYMPDDFLTSGEEYEDGILVDEPYDDEEDDEDVEYDDGDEFYWEEWGFDALLAKAYRNDGWLGFKRTVWNYKSLWKLLGFQFGDIEDPEPDYSLASSGSSFIRELAYYSTKNWRDYLHDSKTFYFFPISRLPLYIEYFQQPQLTKYSFFPKVGRSKIPFFVPTYIFPKFYLDPNIDTKLGQFIHKWTLRWGWVKPEIKRPKRKWWKLPFALEFGTVRKFDLRVLSKEEWQSLLSRKWAFNFLTPVPFVLQQDQLLLAEKFNLYKILEEPSMVSFHHIKNIGFSLKYFLATFFEFFQSRSNYRLSFLEENRLSKQIYFDLLTEYDERQTRYHFPRKRKPVPLSRRWNVSVINAGFLQCIARYSFKPVVFQFNDFLCQEKGKICYLPTLDFYKMSLLRFSWWPSSFLSYVGFRFLVFFAMSLNMDSVLIVHLIDHLYFGVEEFGIKHFFHLFSFLYFGYFFIAI